MLEIVLTTDRYRLWGCHDLGSSTATLLAFFEVSSDNSHRSCGLIEYRLPLLKSFAILV